MEILVISQWCHSMAQLPGYHQLTDINTWNIMVIMWLAVQLELCIVQGNPCVIVKCHSHISNVAERDHVVVSSSPLHSWPLNHKCSPSQPTTLDLSASHPSLSCPLTVLLLVVSSYCSTILDPSPSILYVILVIAIVRQPGFEVEMVKLQKGWYHKMVLLSHHIYLNAIQLK